MSLDLINPINRDTLRSQFQGAKPVPWFKIDNFLREDFANACADAFPTYDQVQKLGVTFTNINEKGKFQVTDTKMFPQPLKQLNDLLNGSDFIEMMQFVTGMPGLLPDEKLVGGGLHSTGARGHLDVHLDFNLLRDRGWHRRLNILVYMNKGWKEDWGGEFELWNEDVSKLREKFLPVFNRCVMFNTNNVSYHGVNAVKCPEGQSRKSFAAYYYTKEAPADFNEPPSNGQFHDTIFKARPDEKMKSMMMPVEAAKKSVGKFLRRGASKLKKAVTGGGK
jgi:Rps23 Pro-64 3,4-dihydroxylase Tpa1-like proline 4-hydroxylase